MSRVLQNKDDATLTPDVMRAHSLGLFLAHERRKLQLTGNQAAMQAGIARRTLVSIEQGDSGVSLGNYLKVAEVVNALSVFQLVSTGDTETSGHPSFYLTGATALCLSKKGSAPALWYTKSLKDSSSWQIGGATINDARGLLGIAGIKDGSEELQHAGFPVQRVWTASYERAVFDLLYHFCECRKKPMANIQVSDIDDAVDIRQIKNWLRDAKPFLSKKGTQLMRTWLEQPSW